MRQNMEGTLRQMASDWSLNPDELIAYAHADTVEGWTYLGYWPGGSVWKEEGKILYALVRALRPQNILECGSAFCCSTTHMLSAIRAARRGWLVSVTLEGDDERVPENLRPYWTFNVGISAQDYLDTSNAEFDFAFEDTDHTVPTTVAILSRLKARESVRTIISHDIAHPWSGPAMREAWGQVFGGEYRAYDIDPSDCGLAVWRRP